MKTEGFAYFYWHRSMWPGQCSNNWTRHLWLTLGEAQADRDAKEGVRMCLDYWVNKGRA